MPRWHTPVRTPVVTPAQSRRRNTLRRRGMGSKRGKRALPQSPLSEEIGRVVLLLGDRGDAGPAAGGEEHALGLFSGGALGEWEVGGAGGF